MKVENNTYRNIYIDVTLKCNMLCPTCYNRYSKGEDLTLEYLEEVFKRLPNKVLVRFLGGEPTIYPYLFEAINLAKKYHHIPSFVTNGLKLSENDYIKNLNKVKPIFVGLSFDGGLNDDYYKKINGRNCLDFKLKAVENLFKNGYKRVSLCTTVIRGLNESAVYETFKVAENYNIKYIHFRSAGITTSKSFTLDELEDLIAEVFPQIKNPYRKIERDEKCCGCCKAIWITKNMQLLLIAPDSIKNDNCFVRGYLRDNFEIEPFYKSIRERFKHE